MRNSLIFLSCLAVLIACGTEEGLDPSPRKFKESITLVPEDTLVFPISYRSNVYSKYIKKAVINGAAYLGVVNENTNELEFYALTEGKDHFNIRFKEEGPDGVGAIRAFELVSDSTLLIATSLRVRLYLTDMEGKLQKTLNTGMVERKGNPYVQIYYSNQPLMFDKSKQDAYVFTKVDTDFNGPGIWSGTMFLRASTKIEDSNNHVFKLPLHFDNYIHGGHFSHSSHLLIDDRYLVLGISFYNNLLIYDLEKGKMREGNAGSKYFGDILPWDSPVRTVEAHEEFYVTSNSYRELAYDEENQLLYRLAYRRVSYTGPDGQQRNWDNKPPSVVIINSDFEKVGEVDLPVNTIYTRMYFTHNGKLYLSLNHPDNNPSEDEMLFVGFKPEGI